MLSLKMDDGSKREGKLLSAADNEITIEEIIKQRGKKAEIVESSIPTDKITETKVLISFK